MGIENSITRLIETLSPSLESLQRDIEDFKQANKTKSVDELAENYADHICWKYASVGVASALPSILPGIGTAAQIATEATSISADLALMLRWMGSMTTGIGIIYGRDMQSNFNQDFIRILGLWCGVLKTAQASIKRIGTKVAIAQFNKVSGTIFQRINQKVGTTILTKYGVKRGGIAIGKLIPFGVGAIVGGSFNMVTMKAFKRIAIQYYSSPENSELYMEE